MTEPDFRQRVSIFGRDIPLPQSRVLRISIGCLLIVGGIVGFLPIVGFWMIPVGILILSYEFAMVRRWRRRSTVWWAGRKGRRDRNR